jgi:23S rRNA (uridine2552-2'-O)-methyltransferase
MSKRWVQEHQRDAHYRQAKREGYRARSAYKLEEINKRYTVIRPHDDVIDLGAAPGGWLQVIREITDGKVIGIDLRRIEPLDNVTCIRGDMTSEKVRKKLVDAVGGKVNTIVSDMSPNISGNYTMDQAQSVYLGEMALDTAESLLDRGGNFVVKVFEGDLFPDFLRLLKTKFSRVKVHNPKASRKTSSEIYVIARNYFPKDKRSLQERSSGNEEQEPIPDEQDMDLPEAEAKGLYIQGSETKGLDTKGSEANGLDIQGLDAKGSEAKRLDTKTLDTKGPDTMGAEEKEEVQ